MQISIDRWSVALGLNWLIPTGRSEVSEAKKANKGKGYVLAKTDHMQWLGIHSEMSANTFAGALLVGLVHPNAIVLHPVPDGMAWICALRDGMPIVGRDLVIGIDEANRLVREWVGRSDDYVIVGDNRAAVDSVPAVLEKLKLAGESSADIRKKIKNAALSATSINIAATAKPAGLVFSVLLLSLGVYSYTQRSTQTVVPAVQLAAEKAQADNIQAALSASQAKEHNKALQQKQVLDLIKQYGTRNSPASLWQSAASVRSQVPVSMYGYRPIRHECDAKACQVFWRGQGRFTQLNDKLMLPNVVPNYTDILEATSTYPVELKNVALPITGATSPEHFAMELRSDIKVRYPMAQFTELKPVAVAPPASTGLAPIVALHTGTWRIDFSGPTALVSGTAFVSYIEKMPMTLTSVKYDPQASRVEFSGEYISLPAM